MKPSNRITSIQTENTRGDVWKVTWSKIELEDKLLI